MSDIATTEVARLALKVVELFLKGRPKQQDVRLADVEVSISRNVDEAVSWASKLQIFGMSRDVDPLTATVPLRLNQTPRRFRGNTSDEPVDEDYILTSLRNTVLLGDPGSGKTTTLKRLVKRLVLGEIALQGNIGIPIVIRLRELGPDESLIPRLASSLGLLAKRRRTDAQADHDAKPSLAADYWIGPELAKDLLADFLRENRTVLILDGLDELKGDANGLKQEINWLGRVSRNGQIVVACRSGDYHGELEGYEVLELCPLSLDEITDIVDASAVDSANFLEALSETPYSELADRPLFLAQLLLIFERYGYLPEQPSDVYRLIVTLLLREWDAERGIQRQTKYAKFSPEKKLNFLAAISYFLTFKTRAKTFSSAQLQKAYLSYNVRFQLPASEAREVVDEIESHTGLVVNAGMSKYEFSHLSLQEYLAAEYMSRETHSTHLLDYLGSYPAPVAISVALASDPSLAFASLLLRHKLPDGSQVSSLLSRLLIERPAFDKSKALGVAILRVLSDWRAEPRAIEYCFSLLQLVGVKESLREAFKLYRQDVNKNRQHALSTVLKRKSSLDEFHGLKTPDSFQIMSEHFDRLIESVGGRPEQVAFAHPVERTDD